MPSRKTKKVQRITFENQISFSSLLLDTLFGLIVYFNIDSLTEIHEPMNLLFYIFSLVVVVHWWFQVKSEEDMYGEEISRTIANTAVKAAIIIFVTLFVQATKTFSSNYAMLYLSFVYGVDIIWCLVFLYLGTWSTNDNLKIFLMENELERNLKVDILGFLSMISLYLFASIWAADAFFVALFIMVYSLNIFATYRYRIINVPMI